MKILKSFGVTLTRKQVNEIKAQLEGVKEPYAILAQPRMNLGPFNLKNPSMNVAIVDNELFLEINESLRKAAR